MNGQFDGPNRCVAEAFIAEGDHVVVEARRLDRTKRGAYENRHCMIFTFRDGDTALAERVLPYAG